MHRNQVFALLSESFDDNQGSYMDPTPLDSLLESDAGDTDFMGSLLIEFLGFETDILDFLAEPAKSDVDFFNKFLEVGSNNPNWNYLRYASDAINSNPSLYSGWIKESDSLACLNYASKTVLENSEIVSLVEELVDNNLDMIQFAPERMRDDGALMERVIAHNPENLEFASERLRRDEEFVLHAVAVGAEACPFIDVTLYESEAFVHRFIERVETISPQTLENIPDSIKGDKRHLIKIAKKLGSHCDLESYVDSSDREFFSAVIGENGKAIYHASADIKDDDELARKALEGGAPLFLVSERLRNDADFVCWAIEHYRPAMLRHAGEEAQDNLRVVLTAVSRQGSALDWASDRLRDDLEVVSVAVQEDPSALCYASDRIRNDKDFVLEVCKVDINQYIYAGDALFSDREFAMFIVPRVLNSLEHFSAQIQDDPLIQSVYYNNNLEDR